MTLIADLPQLGSDWDLTADHIDASSAGAVFFFGTAALSPGIDLGAVGAPGCYAYTNADLPWAFVAGGSSVSYQLAIPYNPALAGATFAVQATAGSLNNALGLETSNGVTGTIGL